MGKFFEQVGHFVDFPKDFFTFRGMTCLWILIRWRVRVDLSWKLFGQRWQLFLRGIWEGMGTLGFMSDISIETSSGLSLSSAVSEEESGNQSWSSFLGFGRISSGFALVWRSAGESGGDGS